MAQRKKTTLWLMGVLLMALVVFPAVIPSCAVALAPTETVLADASASASMVATSASPASSSASASTTAVVSATSASASTATADVSAIVSADSKTVLFINSYDSGFDTVPVVSEQVAQVLKGHATIHYLYMNEKYETDEFASAQLSTQLDNLTATYHYDAVILGDDAAFDYAIKNREKYFSGIPLVYEDVNSVEKAELYENDPLITGVIEAFPMKETIDLARQVMPQAKRVVVINDGSVSAAGSMQQALGEQADFPDLSFETFDCSKRTPEQISQDIAAYGDDTILLYTVFNVDGSGNRYTVAQGVKLVTDAAQIPVFKADGVGVGDGLLGGYVLSYESIGKQTGQIVLDVLDGAAMPSVTGYTTGSCEYLFDANVMHRYGISKSQLPAGSVYLNDTPDFLETYGWVLMWSLVGVAVLIAIIIGFNQRRHHQMQRELAERDIELKAEEAANHAKTVFISRMSHDIRTPLNAMLGMNELALVNIEDERAVRDYLGKAHASGELLLSLVNNILDVSKIESGKMQIAPEPCELKAFCADLHDIFAPLCERKNINLIIRQDAGDAVVLADRVRLNQVFCNLLSNAIKFTPDGGTVIFELAGTASDEESPEQILHCDFTVSDTGPGIADDFRDKMFQPFVQDTRDSSPDNQGSGLGLMIVRSIVELMNGSIAVESAADAGTSFQVHLDFPLTDRSGESAQGKAAATQSPSDGADPAIAGHRALVVEDNDLNAEIIIAMLERAGMEVERAVNGQESVDMVAASLDGAFDIILMDNRMPVMTGMDAARAIRSMDRVWTARIPIIALTADVFDDDVRNLMDAGMDACLSKPIDARKLFQTIAEHLERTS